MICCFLCVAWLQVVPINEDISSGGSSFTPDIIEEKCGDPGGTSLSFSWDVADYDNLVSDSGAGGSSSYAVEWENIDGVQYLQEEIGDKAVVYGSFFFKYNDDNEDMEAGNGVLLLRIFDSGGFDVIKIYFRQTVSGKKLLFYYYDDSLLYEWGDTVLTNNTWYGIRYKYDTGGGTGWCKIDFYNGSAWSNEVTDDSLTSSHTPHTICVGVREETVTDTNDDLRIDRFQMDTSEWTLIEQ